MIDAQRIADRVKGRIAAKAVIELLRGECVGLSMDAQEAYWGQIRAVASPPAPEPKPAFIPMTEEEAIAFGRQVMDYGKYKGEKLDDIPISYLLWLTEDGQKRVRETRRYLASERMQRAQEDSEDDT
jgi:hypothetical protein